MQDAPFFQQQAFAQAYQLGPLEKEYATDKRKLLAFFGAILVFVLLWSLLVFAKSGDIAIPIAIVMFVPLFILVVGGGITLALYFTDRQLHVYVYRNGLLYLNGETRWVVYWQQIKQVSTIQGGHLCVTLYNHASISIPWHLGGFGELWSTIRRKMAQARASATEDTVLTASPQTPATNAPR